MSIKRESRWKCRKRWLREEQREIAYTVPVDEALAAHIARMTPMLADVDRDKLDLSGIRSITIDENMIVGTLKGSEERK